MLPTKFGVSDRQMDTHGKGEISLEEFKDGLLERWAVLDDSSLAPRPVSGCRRSISLATTLSLKRFFKTALHYLPC